MGWVGEECLERKEERMIEPMATSMTTGTSWLLNRVPGTVLLCVLGTYDVILILRTRLKELMQVITSLEEISSCFLLCSPHVYMASSKAWCPWRSHLACGGEKDSGDGTMAKVVGYKVLLFIDFLGVNVYSVWFLAGLWGPQALIRCSALLLSLL